MRWLGWLRPRADPTATPTSGIPCAEPAPDVLPSAHGSPFDLRAALRLPQGLPLLDWDAALAWLAQQPEAEQAATRRALQRAWLLHLRDALGVKPGPAYALREHDGLLLLSALPEQQAALVQRFTLRCRQQLQQLLAGLAAPRQADGAADILIVFDAEESYYRYTSAYLPEGEYGLSGGMHIDAGCSHFVVPQGSLTQIEPVIAHELTHACLSHLHIPAWLNEGLAVGCERQICPHPGVQDPALARHQAYWTPARLQAFWCGRSFLQQDEGQELSYALALLLVQGLAADDWPRLRDFARQAQAGDAGAAAAREHLGLDLGAALAHLLGRDDAAACAPQPALWQQPPERGAFHPQKRPAAPGVF